MDKLATEGYVCCIGLSLVHLAMVDRYTANIAEDAAERTRSRRHVGQVRDQTLFGGFGCHSGLRASIDSSLPNSHHRRSNFATAYSIRIGFEDISLAISHQFSSSSKLQKTPEPSSCCQEHLSCPTNQTKPNRI